MHGRFSGRVFINVYLEFSDVTYDRFGGLRNFSLHVT